MYNFLTRFATRCLKYVIFRFCKNWGRLYPQFIAKKLRLPPKFIDVTLFNRKELGSGTTGNICV